MIEIKVQIPFTMNFLSGPKAQRIACKLYKKEKRIPNWFHKIQQDSVRSPKNRTIQKEVQTYPL